jgi:hypothetical protein
VNDTLPCWFGMELVCCDNALPTCGKLHMNIVPGKGVACGSGVVEEKSDPEPMPGCAPDI